MGDATTREPYPRGGGVSRDWYELAVADDETAWRSRTRVVLSPMAAPSIIGLFGFMGATLMVGAWQAGWYGSAATPGIVWPFAIFFGGLAQLVAGFYALRARDGVAVAAHGTWGAFWLGWGILQLLLATKVMPPIALGATNTSFAFWFIVLTLITGMASVGAMASSLRFGGAVDAHRRLGPDGGRLLLGQLERAACRRRALRDLRRDRVAGGERDDVRERLRPHDHPARQVLQGCEHSRWDNSASDRVRRRHAGSARRPVSHVRQDTPKEGRHICRPSLWRGGLGCYFESLFMASRTRSSIEAKGPAK